MACTFAQYPLQLNIKTDHPISQRTGMSYVRAHCRKWNDGNVWYRLGMCHNFSLDACQCWMCAYDVIKTNIASTYCLSKDFRHLKCSHPETWQDVWETGTVRYWGSCRRLMLPMLSGSLHKSSTLLFFRSPTSRIVSLLTGLSKCVAILAARSNSGDMMDPWGTVCNSDYDFVPISQKFLPPRLIP